jgi:limonene-1,2-epoxide hydrolase
VRALKVGQLRRTRSKLRSAEPPTALLAYISVLTITDRKVTHWRDYLDPVAVFDALGWPSR